MSQHVFRTVLNGEKIEVFAGWDRPMSGFFLVIERIGYKDSNAEPYLFSNLHMKEPHPKTFGYFKNVLEELGIKVPHEMLDEIIRDGTEDKGNKHVIHEIRDGEYVRKVLYEEAPFPSHSYDRGRGRDV
jgi:hypothetical protein